MRPDIAPFSKALFLTAAAGLNRKASARRARWAAKTGRPFPKGPYDPSPDPGTIEGDAEADE